MLIIIIIIIRFCCVFFLTSYMCVEHGALVTDIGKGTVHNAEYIIDEVLCSLCLFMPY
jgi:hypothetical protein